MAAKLSQIVAVEKSAKSQYENSITAAYHSIQKPETFSGIIRSYTPNDDEGEDLPGEVQKVITSVPVQRDAFTDAMTRIFDITSTKIDANTRARADVVVDGAVLLHDMPVETLLFLEKRLIDLQTFLSKIPTLDPAFDWEYDDAAECYATKPVITNRSKKVPRNHVKALATDKHPEQVEVYMEDVNVGKWSTTKLSGAVPAKQVTDWKQKVSDLQAAVKFAREEANSIEVVQQNVGDPIFTYLFG
jgi:hypothetical protein